MIARRMQSIINNVSDYCLHGCAMLMQELLQRRCEKVQKRAKELLLLHHGGRVFEASSGSSSNGDKPEPNIH